MIQIFQYPSILSGEWYNLDKTRKNKNEAVSGLGHNSIFTQLWQQKSLGFHCYSLLIWQKQPLCTPPHELRKNTGQCH